jgi:hypothetical protein
MLVGCAQSARQRHVLSAMTPGIRDSWVRAMQANVLYPSPTNTIDSSNKSRASSRLTLDGTEPLVRVPTLSQTPQPQLQPINKKHIAYVAPESHNDAHTRTTRESRTSDEGVNREHQSFSDNNSVDNVSEQSIDVLNRTASPLTNTDSDGLHISYTCSHVSCRRRIPSTLYDTCSS